MKRSEATVGLGDFQTPLELALAALEFVRVRGAVPDRILEPTCGSGSFVAASYATWKDVGEVVGVEINTAYDPQLAELSKKHSTFRYRYRDVQTLERDDLNWNSPGPLLICGNPPWVTTDALSRLFDSYQLRIRDNPKGLKGLDALTGSASYDISERVALRCVQMAAREKQAHIALLLKESVARRVLLFAKDLFTDSAVVELDSHKWFGVKVQSCLLYLHFNERGTKSSARVDYLSGFASDRAEHWKLDDGVVRRGSSNALRSRSPLSDVVWRHGIKHDASAVFEFRTGPDKPGIAETASGASLPLDSAYLYPFVTARDLHRAAKLTPVERYLFVPQRKLGDRAIEADPAAATEREHLANFSARLTERRSSIYKNKPAYAIFGVGDYTFSAYKVAVAGLYMKPRFRFVGLSGGKPVVLGDTSYFVPCDSAIDAAILVALGNSAFILAEIAELAFAGKRPITKRMLDVLQFRQAFSLMSREELVAAVVGLMASWPGQKIEIPSECEVMERAVSLFRSLVP